MLPVLFVPSPALMTLRPVNALPSKLAVDVLMGVLNSSQTDISSATFP